MCGVRQAWTGMGCPQTAVYVRHDAARSKKKFRVYREYRYTGRRRAGEVYRNTTSTGSLQVYSVYRQVYREYRVYSSIQVYSGLTHRVGGPGYTGLQPALCGY